MTNIKLLQEGMMEDAGWKKEGNGVLYIVQALCLIADNVAVIADSLEEIKRHVRK